MSVVLLSVLVFIDVVLLAAIIRLSRQKPTDYNTLREVTEEREMLSELRRSVFEELDSARKESQDRLNQMNQIAAEIDQDLKSSSQTIASQIEEIATEITSKLNEPVKKLAKKQLSLEALSHKVETQKEILNKSLMRAEKVCRFFDRNAKYEDVISEIEDQKYSTALQLIAKGLTPEKVASEIGISTSEAKLLAGVHGSSVR